MATATKKLKALKDLARKKRAMFPEYYGDDRWKKEQPFGKYPDAMVVKIASRIPTYQKVLDIGAGTGRNALPLAEQGFQVIAIEATEDFAERLEEAAKEKELDVEIIPKDVMKLTFPSGEFGLVVLSEVLTHFRRFEDMKALFEKLADWVSSGGFIVANVFVAMPNFEPTEDDRFKAYDKWSALMTQKELDIIAEDLPFALVSNENAMEFERDNLPEDGWPPSNWYAHWATGKDVFSEEGKMELRWLVFRRR